MIRAFAFGFGLALAGSAAAQERPYVALPSPVSATCEGGLCQPERLETFFAALDQRDAYAQNLAALGQRRTVTIVQFGDSHTAGGDITRSLLWRLQGRFGSVPVALRAHGVVGATLRVMAEREPLLEADDGHPALVVIAYGTNEGFDELLDARVYEELLRGQIRRVREVTGGSAAILVLGAPEAMRGDGGGRCPGDADQRWKAPDMLGVVRDVQHRVAAQEGVAFWDWKGRMGGDCSAQTLTMGAEPLMRGDHVHFTFAGGDWIGSLLAADLIAAYDRSRARR